MDFFEEAVSGHGDALGVAVKLLRHIASVLLLEGSPLCGSLRCFEPASLLALLLTILVLVKPVSKVEFLLQPRQEPSGFWWCWFFIRGDKMTSTGNGAVLNKQ